MTALIVMLACAAHLAAALVTARAAYGRFRLWQAARPPDSYAIWTVDGRCLQAAIWLTVGCLAGLCPLVIAFAAVAAKPPQTPAELRAVIAARDKRVAELERELGIGRTQ
jgi:hypothetical protein